MKARSWLLLALVFLVPLTPRLVAMLRPVPPDPRVLPDSAVDPDQTYSNILPEDYVGPQACQQCHAGKFRKWSGHPHSVMNQLPTTESVKGDFSGSVLRLATGSVAFCKEGSHYRMRISRGDEPLRVYRVTRTAGSRTMQFYIGVQEEGPQPSGHDLSREHMLPFAYWITLGRWLPKPFFDLDGPEELRDGLPLVEGIDRVRDVRHYSAVCMNCHNTFAYSWRIFQPFYVGFPDATVAAALGPLSAALRPELEVAPTVKGFSEANDRLDPDRHLVTLGISCESCHFGGREHAREGGKIRWLPTSPLLKVLDKDEGRPTGDGRKTAAAINGLCTQCHSGSSRPYPTGESQFNSREGVDFHLGACSSQMHCAHCHDPHSQGPPSGGATDPRHLARCLECHPAYRDPEKAARHTRHPAASGVNCLDCHMPRHTLGLDAVVRTHRIGMPVEEAMVARGSPNACNLCHLEKPVRWTLSELERGWGRKITPSKGWPSWPTLDEPVGGVWLRSEEPILRIVAGQSYAASPLGKGKLPELVRALNDHEPIARVFAQRAVERVGGRKLSAQEYELTAPPAHRQEQVEELLRRFLR